MAETMVSRRFELTLSLLSAALLLAAALRYGLMPIGGFDIFWHLETGKQIIETRSTLAVDPFAYTLQGEPWRYKDAGSAVLLYLFYSWFGVAGLVYQKALIFVTTLAVLAYTLLRVRRAPVGLVSALIAITIEATAFRFHERPQTIAFLLTAVAVLVIDAHRARNAPLWPIVPLTWLLANLHRGALVLPVLMSVYWLCHAWEIRKKTERSAALRRLGGLAAATWIACFATPQGTHILTTSLTMLGESGYRDMIPEWHASTPGNVWRASPASFVMLAVLAAGLLAKGRRQDPWDLALGLFGVAMGANGVRFLPYLCILGIGPAASGLARFERVFRGRLGLGLGTAGAALALFYATLSQLPKPHIGWQPHRYPSRALEFVRTEQLQGHVLNSFRHGGYLIFHCFNEHKVYVDGRNDIAYPLPFLRRAVRALDDPEIFTREQRRWNVQWLFIANEPEARSRIHLDLRPDWSLVFASEAALVYVNNQGPNRDVALRHAYRYLKPHALEASLRRAFSSGNPALREGALAEARRMVREDPESYPANVALALAYQLGGPSHAASARDQWQRVHALERAR